jgi:hypothetical protein
MFIVLLPSTGYGPYLLRVVRVTHQRTVYQESVFAGPCLSRRCLAIGRYVTIYCNVGGHSVASWPNTRYLEIGEAVFFRAAPSRGKLKTGPCRAALHHARFQGNAVVNTLMSCKRTLCEPVASQHNMKWTNATKLTGSIFLLLLDRHSGLLGHSRSPLGGPSSRFWRWLFSAFFRRGNYSQNGLVLHSSSTLIVVHLFVWWGAICSPVRVGVILVGSCGYQ